MHQFWLRNILFAFFMTGLCSLPSAATLENNPYLQNASPTSMVVRWRTDTNTDTRLSYGTSPGNLSTNINNPANANTTAVRDAYLDKTGNTTTDLFFYARNLMEAH